MSGYVAFQSLPHQLVNRYIQQGFCFNNLCVEETGIGKSMLIDTLLLILNTVNPQILPTLDLKFRHMNSNKIMFGYNWPL